MQNVTLGGTGKAGGDRHPKVSCGALIGAGAKVLGNIELGNGSRVAASSVVLDPVPALATVAGIPAKVVSIAKAMGPDCMPSLSMEHSMRHEPLVDEGWGI
jgi:serine O-acetyltransferase